MRSRQNIGPSSPQPGVTRTWINMFLKKKPTSLMKLTSPRHRAVCWCQRCPAPGRPPWFDRDPPTSPHSAGSASDAHGQEQSSCLELKPVKKIRWKHPLFYPHHNIHMFVSLKSHELFWWEQCVNLTNIYLILGMVQYAHMIYDIIPCLPQTFLTSISSSLQYLPVCMSYLHTWYSRVGLQFKDAGETCVCNL